MSEQRLASTACAGDALHRHPGFRHFMTGVLIGAAVLAAVFVLV